MIHPDRTPVEIALDRLAAATDELLDLTPADVGTPRALALVGEADEAVVQAHAVLNGAFL